MTLLDTNVLLDIATADPVWCGWSGKVGGALDAASIAGQMMGAWPSRQELAFFNTAAPSEPWRHAPDTGLRLGEAYDSESGDACAPLFCVQR